MRVLHAIASLDLARGGPPRSTYSLCRELASHGAEVRLLTRDAKGWDPAALQPVRTSNGSFDVILAPESRYVQKGKELAGWADIVHFQSVWKPSHFLISRRCRQLGVPYLLAPRGELDVWSMRQKRLKKQLFLALFGRRLIRGSAALHLLNEDEAKGFRALNIEHPGVIVPNGIDPEEWAAPLTGPTIHQRFPGIGERTLIVFFARLHPKKGGRILADAFVRIAADHPDSFIIFAGPDDGERGKIEAILGDGGVAGRSAVLGRQDGEERRSLLMGADIVALPSFQEGHPRTVLEAGYLGKSLLITQECHVPELTDHGGAEAVEPTVDSVARGLTHLLRDPDYRRDIAARAATIIKADFTWSKIAQRQLRAYKEILGRAGDVAG